MSKQLFRKAALQRLSSPEQLDQLMQITSPTGWLALLGTGIFILAVITWGFVGSIPTKVSGRGILTKSGGIFDIVATDSGMVEITYFGAGDTISTGQIVARIQKTEILKKIKIRRGSLNDLEKKYDMVARYNLKDTHLQAESIKQQQLIIKEAVTALKQQAEWLRTKIKNQERLYKKGLVTKQQVIDVTQQLTDTQQSILDQQNHLKTISINSLQQGEEKKETLKAIKEQIDSEHRDLVELLEKLDYSAKVISQFNGRVLDIMVESGEVVSAGSTIMRIELTGKKVKSLEGVVYFPAEVGKRIKIGMLAQIAPATVKQQEYGLMLGLVSFVSEYPETTTNIMKVLHNKTLVQSLVKTGAPIAVRIDPIPDPHTPSGYKWSSSQGPPQTISTGTVCIANIVVKEERPVGMVIPLFKKYFLGQGN
jgi:HlyD family secretion protein